MLFKVIILVCAIGLDHAACNPHSATNIYNSTTTPGSLSISGCMMAAQTVLAQSPGEGVMNYDPKAEYLKVICAQGPVEQRGSREAIDRPATK